MKAKSARGVGNFTIKLVAMATFLEILEKEGRIDHLQFNTYHMVLKIVKIGPADTEILSLPANKSLRHKIGCHGNVALDIEKNSDLSSTPKTLSYGVKIAKIARVLCFAYTTQLVAWQRPLRNLQKWT